MLGGVVATPVLEPTWLPAAPQAVPSNSRDRYGAAVQHAKVRHLHFVKLETQEIMLQGRGIWKNKQPSTT